MGFLTAERIFCILEKPQEEEVEKLTQEFRKRRSSFLEKGDEGKSGLASPKKTLGEAEEKNFRQK